MLRLTPPDLLRLEQMSSLQVEIGGSESNTAAGLARLGHSVCWLSRLTDNALGRKIAREIAAHGVDTSQILWTREDRVGLYFYEEGKAPRSSSVIYDRAGSAMSRIRPEHLPQGLFASSRPGLLHLSGITPALSESARETAEEAARQAKRAGWKLSFDVNFRGKLWTAAAAREGCETLLSSADLIIAPLADVQWIFTEIPEATPAAAAEWLRKRYPSAVVVVTAGSNGACGRDHSNLTYSQDCFPAQEVGRLGGGDAFAAGLLSSYFFAAPGDLRAALCRGAACAALKYATPGDMPFFTAEEVAQLMKHSGAPAKLIR
jgi:2-dehydro-3-deoxygluconokinase